MEDKLELLLQEKEEQIRLLRIEKEELRNQAKSARKQVRKLEQNIQLIQNSRWVRLGNRVKGIFVTTRRVAVAPFYMCCRVYRRLCVKETKRIDVSKSTDIETDASGSEHTLRFPAVTENQVNIFEKIHGETIRVSVIVCIHDAVYDVETCLLSLWENRTFPYEIILVDDGSARKTQEYLEKYAELTGARLIRNESAVGYTVSANQGIHASCSDYLVLLNSDTVVTYGWIEKMLRCFQKHPDTGIVSPLSNAASYQSVPEVYDRNSGDWMINTLEDGMNIERMGQIVERASAHLYPALPVLNGFCLMISRQVVEQIGCFDEVSFPKGYGEEVDYCLRAGKAGFTLRIADDTYIFHAKSKSFTHQVRKELSGRSKVILKEKHGSSYLQIDQMMECDTQLERIRRRVREKQEEIRNMPVLQNRIAFLLTAKGGSGGANSVCQEVMGMRKLGVQAFVLNSSNYRTEFEKNYPELLPYTRYFHKNSDWSLIQAGKEFDIIIGTIFTTVKSLKKIKDACADIRLGYYIQDYEPLFFDKTQDYWKEARESYTLLDDPCMFAKTKWIADTVEREHGTKVWLVEPSIDIGLYNPFVVKKKEICFPIRITAMVRPKTQRRNPAGTMRILKRLKENYKDRVEICIFGCGEVEIAQMGEEADFSYQNYGILKRWEVAKLLARSLLFLDMSDYQAFGRTGLEAMGVGCIALVPQEGGTDKYAVDGVNAVVADTLDEDLVYCKICALLNEPEQMARLQKNGMITAQEYNVLNASVSELYVLNQYFFQ